MVALSKKSKFAALIAVFALLTMQLIDLAAFDPGDDHHPITPDYIEHLHMDHHTSAGDHPENHLMSELHVSFHSLISVYLHETDLIVASAEFVKTHNQIQRVRIDLTSEYQPPVPPPLA